MKIPTGQAGDILLVDSPGILSNCIRWRTGSDWSHCARFIDAENVSEAMPGGVRIASAAIYKDVPWRVRRRHLLDPDNLTKMLTFLEWQNGVKYDWKGVLLGFWGRGVKGAQDGSKWFCSELQLVADRNSGCQVLSDTPASLCPPSAYAITTDYKTIAWHVRKPDGWILGT
jgi:uncharacterized protein YycO